MKRFHLHISVNDLGESIRFYSTLFAAQPTVLQSDYAKWMGVTTVPHTSACCRTPTKADDAR
jgi:extradiol dioxygenase family protein